MSSGLLVFYGIAVAMVLGGACAVFLLLRRYGTVLAVAISLLAAAALVLVWPIPIHGGFMFLGQAMYDEWSRDRELEDRMRADHELEAYLESLSARFDGELPLLHRAASADGWELVTYLPGRMAWFDTVNRQIWSEWLSLLPTADLPSLEAAKKRCQAHPPVGYWSLPTEAEHALMWKAGGTEVLPGASAGSVSFTIDVEFRMETPTYRVHSSGNIGPGAHRRFAVHCVARGPGGPAGGFIRRDIALDDWNRYQLSKAN